MIKGFVLDDARLKEGGAVAPAGGVDYFDELLERLRDIRASEKRFYQKIRDLYATAIDYDKKSDSARDFFKEVQNKMLWAVTENTAAELIYERSNPAAENMGLTSWKGDKVGKIDVDIAKNYLAQPEIEELNRLVVMFLDYAEDQARRRKAMTMADWTERLKMFLDFNEREILQNAGKISAALAKQKVEENYSLFDEKRKQKAAEKADFEDIQMLEQQVKTHRTAGKK